MNYLLALKNLLETPRKVVIITHFKPDADALGSSLGWAGYLVKKGHSVHVITPSDYPQFLAWMPGIEMVLALSKESFQAKKEANRLIAEADVIFCLDFSALSRIHGLGEMVQQAQAKKIIIDHHLEPEEFADYRKWDTTSASTSQLIYELIEELGHKNLINKPIASCLYAGLMADTGSFRHNNTTHREFKVAAELVNLGAQPSEVAKQLFDSNSLERLRLLGYTLSQKLQILPEYNTSYMTLSQDDLSQFDTQTGDTEGLVNYGLSIKGINLSVFMYDRKEEIKLSFRSQTHFDVNALARKHFEGGGHKNAAGGQSKLTLAETLKKFLSILPEYKKELLQQ